MSNAYDKAILLLSDGTTFYGLSTGKKGITTGEICFNTGMTGYQEIFTDPSYYRQIMVTTNAHIGNYGMHDAEIESEGIKISGLVCKKFSGVFSRPSANESIYETFMRENIVGICDVDTRAVVRHIRDKGAMNALICTDESKSLDELKAMLAEVPSMAGLELSSYVSTKEPYEWNVEGAKYRVAVMDYGVKKNILRCLMERGISLKVFPHNTAFETLREEEFDGVMLSNGPGDPGAMSDHIEEVKKIVDSGIPVFGICLGHQLLALSQGLRTEKMFNGHRGINHPIKNLESGKCEITSQNHGFVVSRDDLETHPEMELTHLHLNDETVAGHRLKGRPVFSVQYHPEASPGPHDASYLFDQFVANLEKQKNHVVH